MIFVFKGKGKGKTCAAVGMGIRMLGAKGKVLMIQFLKTKSGSSENQILEKLEGFEIKACGRKGFFLPSEKIKQKPELKQKGVKPFSEKDFQMAQRGLGWAKKAAQSGEYDLLILDEINPVLEFELLGVNLVLDFLKQWGEELDLVLTGRGGPESIIEIADLVTDFKEVKHYFHQGVGPRKGIEY